MKDNAQHNRLGKAQSEAARLSWTELMLLCTPGMGVI
jgi:hypothetical protein